MFSECFSCFRLSHSLPVFGYLIGGEGQSARLEEVRALPKVELHAHLSGSITQEKLLPGCMFQGEPTCWAVLKRESLEAWSCSLAWIVAAS